MELGLLLILIGLILAVTVSWSLGTLLIVIGIVLLVLGRVR